MLRSASARREAPLGAHVPNPIVSYESYEDGVDPEHDVLLADSVGLALPHRPSESPPRMSKTVRPVRHEVGGQDDR